MEVPLAAPNIGRAEDLASTATLALSAKARPDFSGSQLARESKIDYESVFALAARGDACSQALLQQSLRSGWREECTGLHEREFIETRRNCLQKQLRTTRVAA